MKSIGRIFARTLTSVFSTTVFFLFLIPVLLSILTMMSVDLSHLKSALVKLLLVLKSSRSVTVGSTSASSYVHSHTLQTFDNQIILPDLRRNFYDIASTSFDDFQHIVSDRSESWERIQTGVDYVIDSAFHTSTPIHTDNTVRTIYRCNFNISTTLAKKELLQFLSSEQNSNLFFATKDLSFPKYSPIYSFEWYNGTLELIHLPVLAVTPTLRKELIAMRAVDEKRARILFRTMPLHTLSRHDVRYITANSRNIRKDTLIANISLPENLINALVGVQVTELTSSIKATKQSTKASTTTRNSASSPSTSSPTTPHTYSLQILRYSDNLGDIPWLDWYANRYLYFQTVLARLKRALPR